MHTTDAMLDAARAVLLRAGVEGATVQAISDESGAPVGSLYNRFHSRKGLLARLWLRAAQRSQAACLPALERPEALDAAVGAALGILQFTREEPGDAQLLATFRREDLVSDELEPALAEALAQLNVPVEVAVKQLSRRLFGDAQREHVRRVMLAIVDLPLAAVQRYLLAAHRVPESLDAHVARAVRAILEEP